MHRSKKELKLIFESSSSLLKDSLTDIIKNSKDHCFKCHLMAKLDVRQTEDIEQRLEVLLGNLKLNLDPDMTRKDVDFDLLEDLRVENQNDLFNDEKKINKIIGKDFLSVCSNPEQDAFENLKDFEFNFDKNKTDDFSLFSNLQQSEEFSNDFDLLLNKNFS